MAVSALLAVFGFLLGRATAMGTGDVFLLFGLGLHLTLVRIAALSATSKRDTIFENTLEIVFYTHINDGKV